MRRVVVTSVLAAATLVAVSPVGAAAVTPKQVAKAVSRADHSSSLWATVNICASKRYPNAMGIRGQMPTLGFPAFLWMAIHVNYWSTTKKRFEPIRSSNATRTMSLGRQSSGLEQGGAVFPFKAHSGLLNATVTFTWRRSGRTLGQIARRTSAGHRDADFGSPPHYTAAECRIK